MTTWMQGKSTSAGPATSLPDGPTLRGRQITSGGRSGRIVATGRSDLFPQVGDLAL